MATLIIILLFQCGGVAPHHKARCTAPTSAPQAKTVWIVVKV